MFTSRGNESQIEEYLEELAFLADTAGADVFATVIQERKLPDHASYIGSGKVDELSQLVRDEVIDIVIVDDDLSPVQARNLEKPLSAR